MKNFPALVDSISRLILHGRGVGVTGQDIDGYLERTYGNVRRNSVLLGDKERGGGLVLNSCKNYFSPYRDYFILLAEIPEFSENLNFREFLNRL